MNSRWIKKLKPCVRVDLFLFYKEALVNICRHSGATKVSTQLMADNKEVVLKINDNAQGLPGNATDGIAPALAMPPALKRRARLLGARVNADTPPGGGTRITLRMNSGKFKILNWMRRLSIE